MSLIAAAAASAGTAALASTPNALLDDIINAGGDFAAATGSAGAFAVTLHSRFALTTGQIVKFTANHTPTGACTLTITPSGSSALAAKNIKKRTSSGLAALASGDITSGDAMVVMYDGTQFVLVGSVGLSKEHNLIWTAIQYGDSSANTMQNGSCALVNGGKRWIGCSATATAIRYFDRIDSKMPFSRTTTDETSPTITPNVITGVFDGSTEYLLGAASAGTTIYRYSITGTGEAACTVSGATLVGVRRIGWDGTYVYVQDDATNDAGTAIKKFTFAGTTLTYVSTITLGTAPTDTSSACRQMIINSTHIMFIDVDTSSGQTLRTYLLAGTAVDNLTISHPHPIGLVHKWDEPGKAYLITFSDDTGDNHGLRIMVPLEYGT